MSAVLDTNFEPALSLLFAEQAANAVLAGTEFVITLLLFSFVHRSFYLPIKQLYIVLEFFRINKLQTLLCIFLVFIEFQLLHLTRASAFV